MSSRERSFIVRVLGGGGGPFEGDLSGYLVAPVSSRSTDHGIAQGTGRFITLDGGSFLSALKRFEYKERPARSTQAALDQVNVDDSVLAYVRRCYEGTLLSHAHLDHIVGLVAASAEIPISIFASSTVCHHLQDHIFNDKIWPDLVAAGQVALHQLDFSPSKRLLMNGLIEVIAFPLSHGSSGRSPKEYVESTAFAVQNLETRQTFLYFGDLEADSCSGSARNRSVWLHCADLYRHGKLEWIFIECSYPNDRPAEHLYGHLSPALLVEELCVFAACLGGAGRARRDDLGRLNVGLTHIKSSYPTTNDALDLALALAAEEATTGPREPLAERILREVRSSARDAGLACRFLVMSQGLELVI